MFIEILVNSYKILEVPFPNKDHSFPRPIITRTKRVFYGGILKIWLKNYSRKDYNIPVDTESIHFNLNPILIDNKGDYIQSSSAASKL